MKNNDNTFKQTNGFAMQYGVVLGFCGLAGLACFVGSVSSPFLSFFHLIFTLGSPVFAGYLTMKFRNAVMLPEQGFSFGRGFGFTFLMGMYATLWIAVGLFVYLAYFDNGYIFDAYEKMLTQPEYVAQFRANGTWDMIQSMGGITKIVNNMRAVGAGNYATGVIYMSLMVAPVISGIIALITRKAPADWQTLSDTKE